MKIEYTLDMMDLRRKHPEIRNYKEYYGQEQFNNSYQYHQVVPYGEADSVIEEEFNDLLRTEFKLNNGDRILLLYSW